MKFTIPKCPNEEGVKLYRNSELNVDEGISIVVGRNGSGKSTLLRVIEEKCKKNKIPCYYYDNYNEGGKDAHSMYSFLGDFEALACTLFHSEGEQIYYNFSKKVEEIGKFIKKNKSSKELVVLLDAMDSGFDVEGIGQLLSVLNTACNDCKEHNIKMHVLITANNYAIVHGNRCIDIETFEEKVFNKFEEFQEYIVKQYERLRKLKKKMG